MAETEERSLDDFFAKRDKKKRKEKAGRGGPAAAGGSSSAPSNAAAGSGSGGSRQVDGGSGAATNTSTSSARAANKEEDDWKEFEQEEIDYSGLRVHSMQISEKDDEEGEKREETRDNSEELGGSMDRSSGPWNRSAPTQAPVAEIIENTEPVQSSGVYRPPGARETRTRKTPQGPPEIYSDTQFPSLQATAKHDTRNRVIPNNLLVLGWFCIGIEHNLTGLPEKQNK